MHSGRDWTRTNDLTDVNRAHDLAHFTDLTDRQFEAFVDYTAQNSQPLTTQLGEYHEALTC